MPRLSDSMEEGTIITWLKATGDEVKRGEEIVEIETDKANMTYEADASGVLEIIAPEGATLPIGEPIATIGDGARTPAAAAAPAAQSAAPSSEEARVVDAEIAAEEGDARSATPTPTAAGNGASEGNGRVRASPVARRLARELGVDLAAVSGSGPGGRIVKADVEASAQGAAAAPAAPTPVVAVAEPAAAEPVAATAPAAATAAATAPAAPAAPAPAPAPAKPAVPGPVVSGGDAGTGKGEVSVQELTRLQTTVARRMAESKATVPDFTITTEVDMAAAVELRAQLRSVATAEAPAPSFNDMVIKAAALALREYPRANGSYKDGKFELYSRVNVGVAVAAQDALIVPTVFDADRKSLGQISRDARALAARVRAGQITPPELSGGTFTVSNLGMFGTTEFTAVINAPQAAILAVGALRDVPVVQDGAVVPGRRMSITLSCDHRILYGADAAQFLARIRALLEAPLSLAL
jgi:pyruvate dehydrogenase E2 component (dihydrolipoamide acetyltransferase)